jgi:type II secretory pathway pseudopilin PulG
MANHLHHLSSHLQLCHDNLERIEGVSVKKRDTHSSIARRRGNQARGFTAIEMAIVVAIIFIIVVMAIPQLRYILQNAQADSTARLVLAQLRQAREYAIANRRYVQITFPVVAGVSSIQFQVKNSLTPGAGADKNPVTVPLPDIFGYTVFNTLGDTPDGYGNSSGIVFGGANGGPAAGMYFQSDGELVDALAFLPINGTVFIGQAGQPKSARAVTVLGATGRLRSWKTTGANAGWFQF